MPCPRDPVAPNCLRGWQEKVDCGVLMLYGGGGSGAVAHGRGDTSSSDPQGVLFSIEAHLFGASV